MMFIIMYPCSVYELGKAAVANPWYLYTKSATNFKCSFFFSSSHVCEVWKWSPFSVLKLLKRPWKYIQLAWPSIYRGTEKGCLPSVPWHHFPSSAAAIYQTSFVVKVTGRKQTRNARWVYEMFTLVMSLALQNNSDEGKFYKTFH